MSVGVLICLELRQQGVTNPSTLYYRAKDEMYQYYNLRRSHVTYSKGMRGRKARKDDNSEIVDSVDVEITAVDTYGSFELRDTIRVLMGLLTKREGEVLTNLYSNDHDLTETAKRLNTSRQRVEQIRNDIRDKLVTISDIAL